MTNPETHKEIKSQHIAESSKILTRIYGEYRDKGISSIYLWGSITREDWNPEISDIDTLIIVNKTFDQTIAATLKARVKEELPYSIKFGIQIYDIEELNGGTPYTTLAKYQPPGYLLLRFNDWQHVAGNKYSRSNFSPKNFTPQEARAHQLTQAIQAYKIVSGELPIDPTRSSGMQSMVEDVVKGTIGALYWEAVENGHTSQLNYPDLPNIVGASRKRLATKLIGIRQINAYTSEAVLPLRNEIENLLSELH